MERSPSTGGVESKRPDKIKATHFDHRFFSTSFVWVASLPRQNLHALANAWALVYSAWLAVEARRLTTVPLYPS